MNINLQNRQKLLTALALTVVGLWAGDRLVISPLIQSWKDRSTRITDLRKSVANGTQILGRERSIRERWESMRDNMLSNEVSAAEGRVLKAFDQWSQDSRVSVTSIKPQWKRSEEYMTLECRVDAFGGIEAVTRFLYEIEKDPLALKIESVELSSRDNDGSQLTLALQVSGLQLIENTP